MEGLDGGGDVGKGAFGFVLRRLGFFSSSSSSDSDDDELDEGGGVGSCFFCLPFFFLLVDLGGDELAACWRSRPRSSWLVSAISDDPWFTIWLTF